MQQLARLSFRLSDLRTGVWDSPKLVAAMLLAALIPLAGCSTASTPTRQADICEVFQQYPDWYLCSEVRKPLGTMLGSPMGNTHVQMSFVRHESSYRGDARPPRQWLWFIPLGRPSSAKGYAQAQDPVWNEYQAERGRLFRSRSDMEDALDFIGWYNQRTRRQLGIPLTDAQHLYLAYHEGQGGYRRGTWRDKPKVQSAARRVAATADRYRAQLARCESRFRCDSWYQVWPFCR